MIEGIEYRWSGEVMEPVDSLAFIGRNPLDASNVFIATGDSGNGMTHGTIAGMLITDLIMGRDNEWAKLYEPVSGGVIFRVLFVVLSSVRGFEFGVLVDRAAFADVCTIHEITRNKTHEVIRKAYCLLLLPTDLSGGHIRFADVEVRRNLLHVVVIFECFHQLKHLPSILAFELDIVLRHHGNLGDLRFNSRCFNR